MLSQLWKVLRNYSQHEPVSASTLAASWYLSLSVRVGPAVIYRARSRNNTMDVLLDICHECLQANLPLQVH